MIVRDFLICLLQMYLLEDLEKNMLPYRREKRKLLGKISHIFCRSADNARNQPLGILNI